MGNGTKHSITIIWGEQAARHYADGTTDHDQLAEFGTVTTYDFETERDLNHFLKGVEEASGWLDYAIKEND